MDPEQVHVPPSPSRPQEGFMQGVFRGRVDRGFFEPRVAASEEQEELCALALASVQQLLEAGVAAGETDRLAEIPQPVRSQALGLGLAGASAPEELGGLGLGMGSLVSVLLELSGHCASLAAWIALPQSLGLQGLLRFGSPLQRERYLEELVRGQRRASLAVQEWGSAEDLVAPVGRASRMDAGWLVERRRTLVWGLDTGPALVGVMAGVQEPGEAHPLPTLFLVDGDTPGLRLRPRRPLPGLRGLPLQDLELDAGRLPADSVLGQVGEGPRVAMTVLAFSRICDAAIAAGLARASAMEALALLEPGASPRRRELPRSRLARLHADALAAESVARVTAQLADAGEAFAPEAAAARVFATAVACRATDQALALVGPEVTAALDRRLREARGLQLCGGADDVLRLMVALVGFRSRDQELARVRELMLGPVSTLRALLGLSGRYLQERLLGPRAPDPAPALAEAHTAFGEGVLTLADLVGRAGRALGQDSLEHRQDLLGRLGQVAIELYAQACTLVHAAGRLEEGRSVTDLASLFVADSSRRILGHQVSVERDADTLAARSLLH